MKRINKRNIEKCTLGRQSKKINDQEKYLVKQVLTKVINAMEYDKEMSNGKDNLNSEAIFTDGGRITLAMTREEFKKLIDLIGKL